MDITRITLQERLNTKDDFIIIGIICLIYLVSFITLLLIPDPTYGGLVVASRFAFVFAIFPGGLIGGMIFDRKHARGTLSRLDLTDSSKLSEREEKKIQTEDIYRIILISGMTFFALPWIFALFGVTRLFFWNPVHVGENHGYYGYILVVFCILNTKIIKYNKDSFARELIILGFIACAVWGAGWMVDDFLIEQFRFNLGFDTPLIDFSLKSIPLTFIIQTIIVGGISFLIYYVVWWKYYKNKIPVLEDLYH